ncbi:MAG TPA: xylose isomerase [Eoetvoesiella sp.]|uniref:xylose isomerase n=1 Tax=Eoetvoesiella sp. TaxID=1966355 RepID=UPI002C90EDDD|nr:xylose isomerase [Eoetvoesiella sp.]HWK60250.1 xylose isomerase [Eoetvoesiella sp.]
MAAGGNGGAVASANGEFPFLLGCNGRGVQVSSLDRPVSLDELPIGEQFRLVKESGVFDYFDRIPLRENFAEYERAMQKYDLPVHTASWFYMLGRDEALMYDNLGICRDVGAKCHNIMTFTHHADGHVLTDDEIVAHYMDVYERGLQLGVEPSFELHVNMWTESMARVTPIARRIQAQGVPFNYTMDYSHVNFKIGNPRELDISECREAAESGAMVLDPFEEGSLCDEWLGLGIVKWIQLRTVGPNQPENLWVKNDDGSFARGIQYPIVRPKPGEWHSPWHAYMLEPSKEAIRKALRYHATHANSPLRYITTEMINLADYGLGAKYNLFEQNVEAAKFIRRAWKETQALNAAGLL